MEKESDRNPAGSNSARARAGAGAHARGPIRSDPIPSVPKEQEGRGKVVPSVDGWEAASQPPPVQQEIPKDFARTFWRLAIALQGKDLRAEAVDVYFEAMAGIPMWAITESAQELAKTTRFFPTTGEWREKALALHTRNLESLFRGWQLMSCPGTGAENTCGREFFHAAHEFVRER